MNRLDWLLLVLAAANGKALSPIQLQKTLFLLKQTLPVCLTEEHFYQFAPYDYGPFASPIYQDAESLEKEGLITIVPSNFGRWREYSITPSGLRRANVAESKLSDDVCAYVKSLVGWVQTLSFSQLVNYVYERYPSYKVNSVFQD